MPVRIAKIDLQGVQAILTDEGRRWVEQQVPGRAGSVFQQLGRGSVALRLEGLLLGEDALEKLERLRRAQANARPVPFAADIASGLDFTDVLIDALHVRQVAGYHHRYWYRLDVREHVEDPPPLGAAVAALDAQVEADAASWAGSAVGAAGVLQDVTTLPSVLAENPEVLAHLSTGDFSGALASAAASLTGPQLDRIASAVGLEPEVLGTIVSKLQNLQLSDVFAAYQAIRDPSSIPKLLSQNPGLLDRLGVRDLGRALTEKADALTGGQFSQALQALGQVDPAKVVALIQDLREANSLGEFVEKLAAGGIDLVGELAGIPLGDAVTIIQGIQGAADFIATLREVGVRAEALLGKLRAYDPFAPVRALAGDQPGESVDLLPEVRGLMEAVHEVLTSDTAKAVLLLAQKAGAEKQLSTALDVLAHGILAVQQFLEGLRQPLQQLGTLRGLLALTGTLAGVTSRLATAAGDELAMLGLEEAQDASKPVRKAFEFGGELLTRGGAVLAHAPRTEELDGLQESLETLREKLLEARPAPGGAA